MSLAACPGNLENPDSVIIQAGSPSVAGSNGAGGAPIVDTTDLTCVTAFFKKSCALAGCHAAGVNAAAGLDLASQGFAARMVDVPATHLQADATMCTPSKLIDSANPMASWLLLKVDNKQGMCGSQMPLGASAPLAAADETCITTFVTAEATLHSGSGTNTGGAAASTAGAAGASTAGAAGAATAGTSSGGSGGTSAGSGGM